MYRSFHTYFWNDPKVKKWPVLARYLFGFLFTNDLSHLSGIYAIERFYIAGKTGLTEKQVQEYLSFLESERVAFYDSEREVVWVVNMFYHQTNGNPGSKNIRSCEKHLLTLHNSPLIQPFLERYQELNIQYRVSNSLSDKAEMGITYPAVSVSVSVPVSVSDKKKTQKSKKIHIDRLEMTEAMATYASANGLNGKAEELFRRMLTWCEKKEILEKSLRAWEAQFRTFVDKAPQYNADLFDSKAKPIRPSVLDQMEANRESVRALISQGDGK